MLIAILLQPEINSEFCVCQGSITLPVITAPSTADNDPSKSCAYTSLPGSTAAITSSIIASVPVTTDSAKCSVCSPYAVNGMGCTSISGCVPHTPSAYVQAGSNPVHVGTLTSTALSSSISSAIAKLCPTVTDTTSMTHCAEGTVKIPKIVSSFSSYVNSVLYRLPMVHSQ